MTEENIFLSCYPHKSVVYYRPMFDPDVRWDRPIPQEDTQDDDATAPCPITVLCLFKKAALHPRYFSLGNHGIRILKVNFSWEKREGEETLRFFSVATEQGTFVISFSQKTLIWRLERLLGP